jgi:hypothetical protein
MASKRAVILALASSPFAQAHQMAGDIGGSSILTSTSPAAGHHNIVLTATPGLAVEVTIPPLMATHNTLGAHISSHTRVMNSSSTPTHTFSGGGITAVVGSSMTASCPVVTHTAAMPSRAEKHSMTTINIAVMATGGMSRSNASVTTGHPFPGDGAVTGVSVSVWTHEPFCIMALTR